MRAGEAARAKSRCCSKASIAARASGSIETWLARQPGVVRCGVNFATRRARVRWDPAARRGSPICCARVVAIGYRAYPYDPARREALARARVARAAAARWPSRVLAMMQVMMFAVPDYVSDDGVEPEYRLLLEWASLTLTLPVAAVFARRRSSSARGATCGIGRPAWTCRSRWASPPRSAASAWATFAARGAVYYDSVTMFVALLLVARYVELRARAAGGRRDRGGRPRPCPRPRSVSRLARAAVTSRRSARASARRRRHRAASRPGATVPADGDIVDGRVERRGSDAHRRDAAAGQGAGDARARRVSVNRESPLVVRVTAAGEATRLAALARLVERAAGERPRIARVADRVARVVRRRAARRRRGHRCRLVALDPSRALMVDVRRAGRVVPVRAVAGHARGAGRGRRRARPRRHRRRARRRARGAGARHARRVRQDRNADDGPRRAARRSMPSGACDRATMRSRSRRRSKHGPTHPMARRFARAVPHGAAAAAATSWRRSRRTASKASSTGAACASAGPIRRPRCRDGRAARCRGAARRDATRVALGDEPGWLALFALADALRPGAADARARAAGARDRPALLSGDRAATRRGRREGARHRRLPAATRSPRTSAPPSRGCSAKARSWRWSATASTTRRRSRRPTCRSALGSARALTQWTADIVVLGDELPRVADAIAMRARTFRVDPRRTSPGRSPTTSSRSRCGDRTRVAAGRGAGHVGVVAARRRQCAARRADATATSCSPANALSAPRLIGG